jgi:iron complex outermembrane recepter protein
MRCLFAKMEVGKLFKLWILLLLGTSLYGQDSTLLSKDTLRVEITAFGQYRPAIQSHPSIHALRGADLDRFNRTSFLQSLNTLPGVRMEERSPGSYRINMRGSSLRSPFGVRNTKVYYNGLPLTDAGGNTYFNQLAFHNIASMEIAKGPGGSMYGAGTGGVILLNSVIPKREGGEIEVTAGSYGLFQAIMQGGKIINHKYHHAGAGITKQDGYRDHTQMLRANMNYSGEFLKKEKLFLQGHLLATYLQYQTPGGLTQSEFEANPRQARPRVGTLPSAEEAKAAIYQKNLMAGMTVHWNMGNAWKNETGFYGQYNQIKNPSIRNYEERSEPGWGSRSVFTKHKKASNFTQQYLAGGEIQFGNFNTKVFTNDKGEKGTLMTNDDLNFFTWNAFVQWQRQYGNRWEMDVGISYYQNSVGINRKFPTGNEGVQKDYLNDWAPRVSLIYRPGNKWQLSGLLSRGFSPPTVSELLPSTGEISTGLRPEYGWNIETGVRWIPEENFSIGVNAFRFNLQEALVQRRDSTGADFYTNAGGTRQQGLEMFADYLMVLQKSKGLNILQMKLAYTYSDFTYTNYTPLQNDYSGNALPSVPKNTLSFTADAQWQNSFFMRTTIYTASTIWLNDGNTSKADAYQLLGIKFGYGKKWQLFCGVDNLLNQTYSLGNDINAFGGRYFNAAPERNYYAGIRRKIIKRSLRGQPINMPL